MPVDTPAAIDLLKQLRALTAMRTARRDWRGSHVVRRAGGSGKLRELPVEHHLDAAGNSWTTLPGVSDTTSFSAVISIPYPMEDGSTVASGHRGLRVLRRIAEETTASRPSPSGLSIGDEEGARFGRSLFGPRHLPARTASIRIAGAWMQPACALKMRWRMRCPYRRHRRCGLERKKCRGLSRIAYRAGAGAGVD